MTEINNAIFNDLLIVSYFMKDNAWSGSNRTSFQRILYFAAVLSPIFLPHSKWTYNFSNSFFGPYSSDIPTYLTELYMKGFLTLEERKVYVNRVEERFQISQKGIKKCETVLFKLNSLSEKIQLVFCQDFGQVKSRNNSSLVI